ncbi:McrC family protein [Chryseobacterium sp. MFBS3-17]|uniref:McrC family protein n=1 Tax=Chryseobacterium sp. MFBS3-17 TaxID=2886689 RepID=UPI001D0E143A|nr:McrC family protein [Chryseobacterium sp. MFBS3-17]MCC2590970.1 McrC family protein [Chryseobacterium sp. MFBS3-17]
MSHKNFIQVFEYQKLRIGEDGFKENHLNSLVKFNEKNGNKYFTPIYNGVQFGSYVGVIQVGGLTIEILPKADRDTSNSKENKNLWQGVLLNMLRVCKHIQVDNVSETGLKKKYNSILEVYYEIFLNEVEQLVKKGLIKKYRRIENNQLSLKGKLVFSRDIERNLVHKERFFCEHQVYDKDHVIHQILFQALRILDDLVSNNLRDKVKRLLFEFNDFTCSDFNAKHFEKLKLDRKSQPYQKSLDIAKMLILNYSPNLNSGQDQMLTLLFDMNKLWEEYIYRVLQRHADNSDYSVSAQETQNFWEHKTIRPDIVVTNNHNQEKIIIDTKWKIVDNNNPSDDDLKQMFTYNLHWGASKSILLYPQIEQKDSAFGRYRHEPYRNMGEEWKSVKNTCKIGFISILNENMIRNSNEIWQEIIAKM